MAQQVNLTDWYYGEDRTFRFTILDQTGAAVDITGWTVQFEFRTAVTDSSPLLALTVGSGITLTNPTAGILDVAVTRAQTTGVLTPGTATSITFQYGLARTNSGTWTVLAYGTATLTRAGTR